MQGLALPNLFGKRALTIAAGSIVGNMVYDRWISRMPMLAPANGFGIDDVARALTIAATVILLDRFV